jgi:gliding motility-associated lipoprotein GldD
MFYQVGGNAATNAQFYVTDSTRNFVTASMYFYSKPNFDSILPAADYIKNDMKQMIESLHHFLNIYVNHIFYHFNVI